MEAAFIVLPKMQNNQTNGPSEKNGLSTFDSSSDTQEECAEHTRLPILRGIPITVEVESMNRILRSCKCINLGPYGTLVDMGEDKCPDLSVESKLFVIIQLAGEIAKLPGIVRHRHGNRLGIFFPIEGDPHFQKEQQIFSIILRTLQRGIERRQRR